ncbi:MAG TPA: outer membrane lipoprotein carrier protein LolA [Alphaproteobacteria bacterium]|nr:outer membrane lipoprotein carrier protein LolA [Alphaproteobacteria bacterium]
MRRTSRKNTGVRAFGRRRFLAGLATLAIGASGPARAAAPQPADFADLAEIERYLDSIRTMAAEFQQFDQEGRVTAGRIYLSRPGRLRVEYDPPTPYLLVASSGALVYYDAEIDQLTTLPLSSTPAAFLLKDRISLTEGVSVRDFERGPGVLRVELVDAEDEGAGSVLMVFEDRPLALKQWTVTDAQGLKTQVVLRDAEFDVVLDPRLFALPTAKGPGNRTN